MNNSFQDNQYHRPNMDFVCPVYRRDDENLTDEAKRESREPCCVSDLDQIPSPNTENESQTDSSCTPIPSIRKRRQRFTLGCTFLTLGLLVVSFSIPQRNEVIVPGGLTTKHGQLLAGQGTKRCANCHDAGDKPFYSWLTDVVTGGSHLKTPQSTLCLQCHKQMKGPHELHAHNVSAEQLNAIRNRQQESQTSKSSAVSLASFQTSHTPGHEIACATCHKEHHGSQHDLTAMTDAQCQSCHRKKFASFESGHPPFKNYMSGKRRSRIAFDHASHFGKHFPQKGQAFNCSQCHQDDEYQNVKKLVPFEQSCASCHSTSIQNSVQSNLRAFSLPMLDLEAFDRIGAEIGSWPEACRGDFDGPLTELTQLLLATNTQAVKAMEQLGTNFDFSDLDPDDPDQMRAAQVVVVAMKQLFKDIVDQGTPAIQQRLNSLADDPNISPANVLLAKQISAPVVQQAIKNWFPELTEKSKHGAIRRSPFRMAANRTIDEDLLAENPLKNLLRSKKSAAQSRPPVIENVSGSQDQVIPGKVDNPFIGSLAKPSDGQLLAENPLKSLRKKLPKITQQEPTPQQPKTPRDNVTQTPNQFVAQPNGAGELLANNPLKDLRKNRPQNSVTQSDTTKPLPKTNIVPPQITNNGPPPKTSSSNTRSISEETYQKFLEWSQRSTNGNWVVNHQTFSIEYRPTGHADQVLQSLITLAAHTAEDPSTDSLFEKIAKPDSIGLCTSCHTVDRSQNSNSLTVNWNAITRDPSVRGWTRFSHRPHLIQPQTSDCSSCHQLDTSTSIKNNFVGFESRVERGNFKPLTLDNCMSCHQKEQASSSCTTCHSYHIGSKVITRSK